jgi:translocation and assembly module TamA
VVFEVSERLHRTIGAGVGYRSDDGPFIRTFWEHRNILGAGERLRIEAETSQILQRLEAQLRKPDIFIPDLDLVGGGALRREETDAFDSLSVTGNVGVERRFSRRLTGTAGVAYRLAEVEDSDGSSTFGLFAIPLGMRYDASDDLLDPTRGFRIIAESAPMWDTLNPGTTFVKNRLTATRYFRAQNDPRLVLAFRGSAGAIVGAEIDDIPADVRFYAGGGGSIRGVPFQLAGPLDDDNDPTGGRSVFEGSAEVRYQLLGDVEGVLFLDGGSAFEDELPEVGSAWQFGTGAGLRYLTPVGPIRVDVGVPVDRRDDIDDAWQLYISIGQAF